MDSKGAHEIAVFAEFIEASGVTIDPQSISARQPPEPDIYCRETSGPMYFELGRLLNNEMQRLKLEMMRCAPMPVASGEFNPKLPEREMLRAKIAKSYSTGGYPLELLLYYDNTSWLVGDVPAVPDFADHAKHVMQPLVEAQTMFRRVWVFERHRRTVLWKHEAKVNAP